ncbi:MAG: ABC transporter permease [Rhodospirillum sp.]|nr:ABC transporter permease [Rhodospirillum sp.]MCF8491770.1 ABC transporter permease [Rhodospirillum sp.]
MATGTGNREPQSFERRADERGSGGFSSETVTTLAIFGLCVLLLLASRFISPAFGSLSHLQTILILSSFLIVAGFGQGMVIMTGGLDLSIASIITLGGVACTTLGHMGSLMAIPLALVICAGVGLVSGFGVAKLRIPPFIMTMAMGVIVYSACLGYTKGSPWGSAPEAAITLMKSDLLGLPLAVYFVVAFALFGWFLQKRTSFGRRVQAVGSNARAAQLAGVRAARVTMLVYAASAASAGLVGVMLAGYADGATLRMGESYLLTSIAAVVIGGSSILGGAGTFLGTVGGAILLTTLGTIIQSLGVDEGWRTIIEGMIIVIALLLLRDQLYTKIRMMTSALPGR